MTMTERSRAILYRRLSETVRDEQAVQELLSHFPAAEGDELVTKQFLRAEVATVRTEIAGVRTELHTEISGLRVEMHQGFRRTQAWMVGTMIALSSVQLGYVVLALR